MRMNVASRLLILISCVALCSCQAPMTRAPANGGAATPAAQPVQPAVYYPPTLPESAWTGQPMPAPGGHPHPPGHSCPHCGTGALPAFQFQDHSAGLQWVPDGISCPWPKDEFIHDGGDFNEDVHVKRDWTVVGLDQEDTIAHYDTLDGRTEIAASNRVCIYAPRFAAVRKVTSPILYEGHERIAGVEQPTKLNVHEEQRGPRTALQPEQVVAQLGLDQAPSFREQTKGLLVDNTQILALAEKGYLPHEELLFIQRGQFDAHEKARLAERVAAAVVWTENKAVQVIIDGKPAVEARGTAKPEVTYTYELEGKPRLRICKIADKSEAKPGEIVRFTLRFDNVGEQPIGNVTVIDHLMPRLEFVEGSAECSLKADFMTQPQSLGDTLVLRWEIQEPMEVNQGGIIRFQARVR